MGNSKEDVEEDEPDWEILSVLPMSQCSAKRYSSGVWDYFGQLMQGDICVDNKNFYCSTCFNDRKLKQYSVSTANTNMYRHLSSTHNIHLERTVHRKSAGENVPKKSLRKIKREPENDSNYFETETNDNLEDNAEDPLNELLVVKKLKKDDDETYTAVSSIQRAKAKKVVKPDRLRPSTYGNSSRASTSSAPRIPLRIEESINSEDFDRLFILSLIKEFRRIPDIHRLNAKSDMINVLLKYQELQQSPSSSLKQAPGKIQEFCEISATEYIEDES